MVPRGLGGEREPLRTGVRQGAGRYPEERLVSGGLARERQLLHSLRGPQPFALQARCARCGKLDVLRAASSVCSLSPQGRGLG